MAITEAYAGTETVTTTEWSLTTDTAGPDADTTDGVYQCYLDLNALLKGDVFQFKVYEKVGSASTQRLVYSVRFSNAQSEPVWVSPSLILLHGWDMTLLKVSGTDRAIDWSVRKIA
jgi:hypothetical protein